MKRSASEIAVRKADAIARKRARRAPPPTVRQIVKSELAKQSDNKYWQQSNGTATIDYTGNMYNLLAGLVRGDTSITFDGTSIQPQHLLLRYTWNGSTANAYNTVRTIVFQWFDTTAPTTAAILAVVGAATAPMQPTHIQNKRLFKVLFDKMDVVIAPYSGATGAFVNKVYIPASKFRKVTYQNAANVIVTGGIYLLVVSDDAVLDFPDFSYASEVKFTD